MGVGVTTGAEKALIFIAAKTSKTLQALPEVINLTGLEVHKVNAIMRALKEEEAKFRKQIREAQAQLDTIHAAMEIGFRREGSGQGSQAVCSGATENELGGEKAVGEGESGEEKRIARKTISYVRRTTGPARRAVNTVSIHSVRKVGIQPTDLQN